MQRDKKGKYSSEYLNLATSLQKNFYFFKKYLNTFPMGEKRE
jgi:hypothetical protein